MEHLNSNSCLVGTILNDIQSRYLGIDISNRVFIQNSLPIEPDEAVLVFEGVVISAMPVNIHVQGESKQIFLAYVPWS